jgi:hypothetical protein
VIDAKKLVYTNMLTIWLVKTNFCFF